MKLLAVFAHPDDETFGPGGTLARYALEGHESRLLTFTRGEAGSLGPARNLTRRELGRVRTLELECAARALHFASQRICDLPDKKLAGLPDETGVSVIRQEIDTFGPDLIVTFHIAGISGHPDHCTVARWCLEAVRDHGGPRLLGFGLSEEQARRVGFRELLPIPEAELTHALDVSDYLQHKLKAIQCHKSQSELWQKLRSLDGGYTEYAKQEHFAQAFPSRQPGASPALRLED
jgi:LmbE family N-acetylglucosaminyl deacetylase